MFQKFCAIYVSWKESACGLLNLANRPELRRDGLQNSK